MSARSASPTSREQLDHRLFIRDRAEPTGSHHAQDVLPACAEAVQIIAITAELPITSARSQQPFRGLERSGSRKTRVGGDNVTFQSEAVPFILTAGIVPLALLGITYTTLFLVRRTNPDLPLTGLAKNLRKEIWSVNGVYGFILSIGAVFTAWNVQCFRNPTGGTPWPTLLLTMVTMAGVASTVPMGLSSK